MWKKFRSNLMKKIVLGCQAENHEEELTGVQKYLHEFEQAKANKDLDAMERALVGAKNHCRNANSYCLDEVFCPECPFGGLPVQSGRSGL